MDDYNNTPFTPSNDSDHLTPAPEQEQQAGENNTSVFEEKSAAQEPRHTSFESNTLSPQNEVTVEPPTQPAQPVFNRQQYPYSPPQQYPYAQPLQPQSPYAFVPNKKKKPKKAKNPANKKMAAFLCVCLLGSGAFGFGGNYLANELRSNASDGTTSGSPVVYQSTRSPSGDTGEALAIKDVAAIAKQSVVEIRTESLSTNPFLREMVTEGAGSGVILTVDGYIITNNHVIDGANTISVSLSDGTEYTAELIGKDSKTDLAIIKIAATGLTAAVLGNSADLETGDTAIAVGNPLGELGGTVTEGIISALDREITIDGETMNLLQTSAAINPGNSGGGLFNIYGELVGIVNAKSSGTDIEGLGFAIPIDSAKQVIEDIIKNGYVTGRVEAGFSLLEVSDAMTARMYGVNTLGLYIMESKSADFLRGDRIISMDGKEIADVAGFKALLEDHSVGDVVEITVIRDGVTKTVSLTLGEKTQ
ncbi:MAG: trypsin-like peptidase domain-containing protein [Oscillospiraceae bacterium]|jgi:serine protease Do|nr:trypsin-like peptidase domain-containing protein [Oscillospiraceae bacterium]